MEVKKAGQCGLRLKAEMGDKLIPLVGSHALMTCKQAHIHTHAYTHKAHAHTHTRARKRT